MPTEINAITVPLFL